MRILVNDFAGHPFQLQLSRELARRGHSVLHTYLSGLQGPKGTLAVTPGDPPTFAVRGLCEGNKGNKYSLASRFLLHHRYVRELGSVIDSWRADVVLSGNTPIDAQSCIQRHCRRTGVAFVHWMQDLYCVALQTVFRRKFGPLGRLLSKPYSQLERRVCKGADAVVPITSGFVSYLEQHDMRCSRTRVIRNWSSLDEVVPAPRRNSWAVDRGLSETPVLLYSGTLGMKHRPELLWSLATKLTEGVVAVVSEGLGRNYLDQMKTQSPGGRIVTFDHQQYSKLSDVLGSADVLLAVIDAESSRFAVPSKVLSYLCAGRPVLLAAPEDNLAAQTLRDAGAGVVVSPDDEEGFTAAALELLRDEPSRAALGRNGRSYAERHFNIETIADEFEQVLAEATRDSHALGDIVERLCPARS